MNDKIGPLDERFLMHRLRATSVASMGGMIIAMGCFLYHDLVNHVWNWELLSIGLTMVVIKQGLMLWYRFTN